MTRSARRTGRRPRGPGAVPTGSRISAPAGTPPACGWRRGSPPGSRSGQRDMSGRRISAMRPSSASSSTISRPWNSPTTAAVRSSAVGPRPPLVQISVAALGGEEAQRAQDVRRAGRRRPRSRSDRRPARAAARTATGPLRSEHAAGQHLGPGDDDARADAHRAGVTARRRAALRADSGWRPRSGVISRPIGSLRRPQRVASCR